MVAPSVRQVSPTVWNGSLARREAEWHAAAPFLIEAFFHPADPAPCGCPQAATDHRGPSANRSGCPPADCAAAAEQERQARRRFLRRYGLGEARAPLLWLHRDRWSEPFSLDPDG